LDAIVAERVMGQTRHRDCPLDDRRCPGEYTPSVGRWPCLPPYSTDIAAAWLVEVELDRRGLRDAYIMSLWRLAPVSPDKRGLDNFNERLWLIAHADPADRCRAALMTAE
jgi:hypothetical protein